MSQKSKRILIVEDEKPIARALVLKLNNAGFYARAVFGGEEALKLLKKEKFDLFIIDLIMPKITGFDVLADLKAKKNKVPVIVITNLGQEEDFKRAKKLGVKDYFVKSDTSMAEIVEHIKQVLNVRASKTLASHT